MGLVYADVFTGTLFVLGYKGGVDVFIKLARYVVGRIE